MDEIYSKALPKSSEVISMHALTKMLTNLHPGKLSAVDYLRGGPSHDHSRTWYKTIAGLMNCSWIIDRTIYRERITTRQAFLRLNTPRTTILQIWCTHFAMYLPQFISPHRRQIHGLFVDLQAKAERQNQDSQHLMNEAPVNGETKRPEWGKGSPLSTKAYSNRSIALLFVGVSSV